MIGLKKLHDAIGRAVAACVSDVSFDGIEGIELTKLDIGRDYLKGVASQLAEHGQAEIIVPADIQIRVRISNSDALRSNQEMLFQVALTAKQNGVESIVLKGGCWGSAWQMAMEPIKAVALESMKEDVRSVNPALAEGSYGFQAALVMVASEMIGPYPERIAAFLGYPASLVQVVGARLYEAGIWADDEVCCETWFDPTKGRIAALCDIMVAQGSLKREWSKEDQQFRYRLADTADITEVTP